MNPEPDDAAFAAWKARHAAHLAQVGEECGFNPAEDHAALVVRFFEADSNRYSADHDDPVLGPILKRAKERYLELRRYDFTFANKVSQTEAVRTIMALDLRPESNEDRDRALRAAHDEAPKPG